MKLPHVKRLLSKTKKTTILALAIAAAATCITFQFDRGNLDNKVSDKSVQDLVTKVEVSINETDWTDKQSINQTAETLVNEAVNLTQKEDALSDFQKVSLVRVVDGDTLVVDICANHCDDPTHEYTVRLIGVNTPESVASEEYLQKTGKENTEEGKNASDYTKMLLENIDYLYLEKDTSDTDRYDRLLRYVWLEFPTNDIDTVDIATSMLNGILLKDHIAEVATYEPDTKYKEEFETIFQEYE